MIFNSIEYIIFFVLVFIIYFNIKQKYRWMILLSASYYFYMSWKVEYVILIIISTIVDYYTAIFIYNTYEKKIKKRYLFGSISINLGLLFIFKYFNFVSESVRLVFESFSLNISTPMLYVLLPIGISFYTFQTISYTVDIYNNKIQPEKHLGIFALYVSFFPQLVAGPIERAKNMIPQFRKQYSYDYISMKDGIKLIFWGLFKKVVIADRLAIIVDFVYNNPTNFNGIVLIVATVMFAFQIYCDFSGYTDIAIGSAQVLGFKLSSNFKRPYLSKSVSEFWTRWHISLSNWFRDYVYIPLGGNKVGKRRLIINVFIVFGLCGLWHGANWTFILFGLYFWILVVLYHICKKWYDRLPYFLQIITTFGLVCVGWIFFRANNVSDLIYIFMHLFDFSSITLNFGSIRRNDIILSFLLILFIILIDYIQEYISIKLILRNLTRSVRWIIYILMIWMFMLFGVFGNTEFIYFQF